MAEDVYTLPSPGAEILVGGIQVLIESLPLNTGNIFHCLPAISVADGKSEVNLMTLAS